MNNETVQLSEAPIVKVGMLIRKPVAQVFEAFIDPDLTTQFWFTRSSGRVETGKRIRWEWEMYGAAADIQVLTVEQNQRIRIEWPGEGAPTIVEWIFQPHSEGATFVTIINSGFQGTGDEIVKQALNAEEAFALVLAGLKAYLEHHVSLNLITDRFPDQLVNRPE